MAVEPLSSAMAYQAQSTVKPQTQPVQPADTDVSPANQTANVDAATSSVQQAQAEEDNGNGSADGSPQQKQQGASESLKKAVAEMNRKINNTDSEAVFGIHEKTNRITIKIVNKDTKEILKEYPPEKTLDMIAKVWEVAGILVDEKL